MSKKKRLTIKQAALYVNERLTKKWKNPVAAIESNVYRGKLELSAGGQLEKKRTFLVSELNRFIKEKNSPRPKKGVTIDLSGFIHMFGFYSDTKIAKAAGCSRISVLRYRQQHGILSSQEAGIERIKANAHRLGKEPAIKLAKELRVNRMTVVNWMKLHKIPAYDHSAGPVATKPTSGPKAHKQRKTANEVSDVA